MKLHQSVAIALLFSAALVLQAKDKKPAVSAVFGQAKYVYVEAIDGKEFDPNLDPDDRIAIADVIDALDKWRRYILTTSQDEAEVVIVVRKGRLAREEAGISPRQGPMPGGAGQPGQPGMGGPIGPGVQMGAEAGPPDDLFEVCQVNTNGKLGAPLWQRSMPNGLTAPDVMLLKQFEEAVDKAYPPKPAPAPQAQTQGSQTQPAQQQPAQGQKP